MKRLSLAATLILVAACSNNDARRVACDDGEPADGGADHMVRSFTQCVVVEHDNGSAFDERADRLRVGARDVEEITSRAGHEFLTTRIDVDTDEGERVVQVWVRLVVRGEG